MIEIYVFLSPPCWNFSNKSEPGITSDEATRRVALERALKGHRRRQRQWRTMLMVSNRFHRKNKIEVERAF
jgi:hypothetical protein